MIRLLVCGGRHFHYPDLVSTALDRFVARWPIGLVIHGNARGADKLAGEWARRRGIEVLAISAEWDRFDRGAGPIRNQRMLDEGRPHGVVAFPGRNGTKDMVMRASETGLPVWRPFGEAQPGPATADCRVAPLLHGRLGADPRR